MANKLIVWGLVLLGLASCKHENDLTGFPHPDDGPAVVLPCPDSVVDIDGNVYQVIDIDGTCWAYCAIAPTLRQCRRPGWSGLFELLCRSAAEAQSE